MLPDRPLGKFLPNPKLKLREQLAEVCRYRHMSHRTENAYWHWIKGFIQFHRKRSTPHPQSPGTPSPPAPLPFRTGEGGVGPVEAVREAGPPPSDCGAVNWRHPRELGAAEVQAYLSHLASVKDVAKATQNQAFKLVEG